MSKNGYKSAHFGGPVAGFLKFLLLLLLSTLARVCCGQLSESRDNTPTIFARSGQVVILPCNLSTPTPSPDLPFVPFLLQWARKDLPYPFYIGFSSYPPYIDAQYSGRVSIAEDLGLQIDGTVSEDDGVYECQIIVLNGNYGDIGNGTFVQLVIIGPPRFLSTPPPLVVFHEGKRDSLQCVAKGTPTPAVTWQKDGRSLTADHIRTTVNSIEFEGVRRDDGGTYVCKAESEEGAVQHTIRLLIHGAPFIFIPPHNLTVPRGEAALFECEAEASPDNATQRWYSGEERIQASSAQHEFLPGGGLAIRGVKLEDEGWYSCSPTNGLGEPPVARAFLDVQYPAFVTSMPASIYIARGLDVTLHCLADSDPPIINVEWFRASSQIILRGSSRYSISSEGSLTISGTELVDSGPYSCIPYNKLGTDGMSPITVLFVKDPPQFVIRPEPVYQRVQGEDILVPCTATGDPTPTISWEKVEGTLSPVRSSFSPSSLMIRGMTKEDHGMYHCLATNEVTTVVSPMQLIVELTSPHEPYDISVATTISSARVAWQPAYSGGFTQTFIVWHREKGIPNANWSKSELVPKDLHFYVVLGLQPSTDYQFALVASNQLGDSDLSEIVTATTKDADDVVSPTDATGSTLIPIYMGLIPSPPENLTISPTPEGLLLAWHPPSLWGHFVNRYSVEYRLEGPWVVLYDRVNAGKSELILADLQPNTTYFFRMFAFTPLQFSAPSAAVSGFTGVIPAYLPPEPTTQRMPHLGEPGILAGVLAAICFFVVSLLLCVLAIYISTRRKRQKRLNLFSVAAQTPQPLMHRLQQTQAAESPGLASASAQPQSLVSKIIVKISPKHRADQASAPQPNRHAHLTSNGKLPSNYPSSEPSLSERLLGRPHQPRPSPPGSKGGGGYTLRRAGGGGIAPRRLASEQALELVEFEPSSAPAGVYSVRDGRIRTHGLHASQPHTSGDEPYEAGFTDGEDIGSDAHPDTHGDTIPRGLAPIGVGAPPPCGDYVYYHGNMFITSNSDDNEDYIWASDAVASHHGDSGDEEDRGVVNPALVVEDHSPSSHQTPSAQNQYVDMPTKNLWSWDRDWADVTLSESRRDESHSRTNSRPYGTLPRQSTKKDVRRLSRDDNRSGPPPAYHSSPPFSDSVSTIQGSSLSQRHQDDSAVNYGEPHRTKMRNPPGAHGYGEPVASRRSPQRRTSPQRSPDYERLRTSPVRPQTSGTSQKASNYGEPRMSKPTVSDTRPDYHRPQGPHPFRRPRSPYRHGSNYATYNRTNRPRNQKDIYSNYPSIDHRSPSGTERSPSRSEHSPSRTEHSPSRTERSPSRTERPPLRTEHSPSRTERSPSRTERSPSRTEHSPSRTERPPLRTERSPSRTERSPSRTEHSPSRTEHSPSRIERSPSRTDRWPESESYRKPVQQVRKVSPERSVLPSQGRYDSRMDSRRGRSGATSADSFADTETLHGTLQEKVPPITPHPNGFISDSTATPKSTKPQIDITLSTPVPEHTPKINGRVSPQGGSNQKLYEDAELAPSPRHRRHSPNHSQSPQGSSRDRNYESVPYRPTEGSIISLSPATVSGNSRASVSSVDSRPGSTKPLQLPQAYLTAHQRSLVSPNSSSGYGSRNTSQSTSSRGRTSSVPSIHDPTLSTIASDGVDSPFSDSAGPFSNVSSKESEETCCEDDPMLHQSDLLDALKRYYQPVDTSVPKDQAYEKGTGKVANMEKRCEELKKEFQEYQRKQARSKRRLSRITSSV